jgi:peptidoglycan hydrolase CwlO-like protein
MNLSNSEVYVSIVLSVIASGGFATIVVKVLERGKTASETGLTDAQATDVLVTAGEKAVGILEKQLDRAIKRLDSLEAAVADRDARIAELEREVEELRDKLGGF